MKRSCRSTTARVVARPASARAPGARAGPQSRSPEPGSGRDFGCCQPPASLREFCPRECQALEPAVGHDFFVALRANLALPLAAGKRAKSGARTRKLAVIAVFQRVQVAHQPNCTFPLK